MCLDTSQVELYKNEDFIDQTILQLAVKRCDPKTLQKGKVCKSEKQVFDYLKELGGAFLIVLLPNSYIESNDYENPIKTSFDARVVMSLDPNFSAYTARTIFQDFSLMDDQIVRK